MPFLPSSSPDANAPSLGWPALPTPPLGFVSAFPTCVDVMVSVQSGELLAIVPGEGVARVAMVTSQPQPVKLALRFQAEAGILCEDLAARPVLHGHQQLVVALVREPVNILQPQPVLAIDVPEPLLGRIPESISGERCDACWGPPSIPTKPEEPENQAGCEVSPQDGSVTLGVISSFSGLTVCIIQKHGVGASWYVRVTSEHSCNRQA